MGLSGGQSGNCIGLVKIEAVVIVTAVGRGGGAGLHQVVFSVIKGDAGIGSGHNGVLEGDRILFVAFLYLL